MFFLHISGCYKQFAHIDGPIPFLAILVKMFFFFFFFINFNVFLYDFVIYGLNVKQKPSQKTKFILNAIIRLLYWAIPNFVPISCSIFALSIRDRSAGYAILIRPVAGPIKYNYFIINK